jgi:hypothetical protein
MPQHVTSEAHHRHFQPVNSQTDIKVTMQTIKRQTIDAADENGGLGT